MTSTLSTMCKGNNVDLINGRCTDTHRNVRNCQHYCTKMTSEGPSTHLMRIMP